MFDIMRVHICFTLSQIIVNLLGGWFSHFYLPLVIFLMMTHFPIVLAIFLCELIFACELIFVSSGIISWGDIDFWLSSCLDCLVSHLPFWDSMGLSGYNHFFKNKNIF